MDGRQLALKLRACGVTISDEEMRDPARLNDVLQQVRKSVQMCAEVLRDARFGMDNEDWPEDEEEEQDEAIGERLMSEWEEAGYPPFYYDGSDHLQFNYEPAENVWFVGEVNDMAEAIANIHFLKNRTVYTGAGMCVRMDGNHERAELLFRERVPSLEYLREALTGIYRLKVWKPEHVAIPATPEFSQDRELAKWLTSEWEKRRRPHVYYEGGDVLDFKKTPTTKPTYTKTFPSFEQAIFVCRKLKQKQGFKGISIFINSNFSVTNEVSFYFYGYVPDRYTLTDAIEAY